MLKYSYKFSVKYKNLPEPQPLRLRVSFLSQRIELYTGIKVNPNEWDGSRIKKRVDPRNRQLVEIENRLEGIFKKAEILTGKHPTKEEIRLAFTQKDTSIDNLPFVEIIKMYINEKAETKQWESDTTYAYNRLVKHIENFNIKLKVNQITQDTLRDLIKHFSSNRTSYRTGRILPPLINNTIKRNIYDYCRILKWAKNKGYYSGDAHENFEQRFKGTSEKLSDLVYLEWEELLELYHHTFKIERLNEVRDVFCFCCFTGLRFSDVYKLKKHDVSDNYIRVVTKKTSDPLIINLNDFSKSILEKYKDVKIPNDSALPVRSKTRTNVYLKEIGEEMNWDTPIKRQHFKGNEIVGNTLLKKEVISTHAGRRTFVINALRLGIPSEVIIKWTGHKDFTALKPYVKIVDEVKQNEMNKFNIAPKTPPK